MQHFRHHHHDIHNFIYKENQVIVEIGKLKKSFSYNFDVINYVIKDFFLFKNKY